MQKLRFNILAKNNGKSWASKEDTCSQCLGFTKYVYHEVFGVKLGSVGDGSITASFVNGGDSRIYDTYKNAMPGDVLYFKNAKGQSSVHFGIFISADETGVTIYNSNVSTTNKVEYRKYDFKNDSAYLAPYIKRLKIIRFSGVLIYFNFNEIFDKILHNNYFVN